MCFLRLTLNPRWGFRFWTVRYNVVPVHWFVGPLPYVNVFPVAETAKSSWMGTAEDDDFAVVATLSPDNIAAAGETILLLLAVPQALIVNATEVRVLLVIVTQLMDFVALVMRSDWAKSWPRFISRVFGGLSAMVRACTMRTPAFPSYLIETLVRRLFELANSGAFVVDYRRSSLFALARAALAEEDAARDAAAAIEEAKEDAELGEWALALGVCDVEHGGTGVVMVSGRLHMECVVWSMGEQGWW